MADMTTTARSRALKPPAGKVDAISIHEAGHAVIGLAFRHRLAAVTIRRAGHIGGYAEFLARSLRMYRERPDGVFVNVEIEKFRRRAREVVCVLLAGREAEQLIFPVPLPDSDLKDREMIAQMLPQALDRGESEARVLRQLEQRTQTLVRTYREVIVSLAELLVSNESLTATDVRRACEIPMAVARKMAIGRASAERRSRT